MTEAEKFYQGLSANGFRVVGGMEKSIYYQGDYLLTMDGKRISKLSESVAELSDYKFSQLIYSIKKYQGLLEHEALTEF